MISGGFSGWMASAMNWDARTLPGVEAPAFQVTMVAWISRNVQNSTSRFCIRVSTQSASVMASQSSQRNVPSQSSSSIPSHRRMQLSVPRDVTCSRFIVHTLLVSSNILDTGLSWARQSFITTHGLVLVS